MAYLSTYVKDMPYLMTHLPHTSCHASHISHRYVMPYVRDASGDMGKMHQEMSRRYVIVDTKKPYPAGREIGQRCMVR
jgi:hypothetical protein